MPELPEVEITRRGIADALIDRRITAVAVRNPHLRWPVPDDLPALLQGRQFKSITRRAKYLLFDLGSGGLILHLGMSGSLRLVPAEMPPGKHDHIDVYFEDEILGVRALRYRDPRRFGALLWHPGSPYLHPLLVRLGPEPLEEAFSPDYLYSGLRKRRCAIKLALMDNQLVVGVGNIYANESLFRARISPLRSADQLSLAECTDLCAAVRETLSLAIAAGGSTLRDFVDSAGQPGYFQQSYYVYGRQGEPCFHCGSEIRQTRIGQRSTFWCPHCQSG